MGRYPTAKIIPQAAPVYRAVQRKDVRKYYFQENTGLSDVTVKMQTLVASSDSGVNQATFIGLRSQWEFTFLTSSAASADIEMFIFTTAEGNTTTLPTDVTNTNAALRQEYMKNILFRKLFRVKAVDANCTAVNSTFRFDLDIATKRKIEKGQKLVYVLIGHFSTGTLTYCASGMVFFKNMA